MFRYCLKILLPQNFVAKKVWSCGILTWAASRRPGNITGDSWRYDASFNNNRGSVWSIDHYLHSESDIMIHKKPFACWPSGKTMIFLGELIWPASKQKVATILVLYHVSNMNMTNACSKLKACWGIAAKTCLLMGEKSVASPGLIRHKCTTFRITWAMLTPSLLYLDKI